MKRGAQATIIDPSNDPWERDLIFADDPDGPAMLAEVPTAKDNVDLRRAWIEFERDCVALNRAVDLGPDQLWNIRMFVQAILWAWFWSVRSPDAESRAMWRKMADAWEFDFEILRAGALMKARSSH